MVNKIRQAYNAAFTKEKYNAFIADLNATFQYEIGFRVAETPVFIDRAFRKTLEAAGEEIISTLLDPDFKKHSAAAIPSALRVPNEDQHPSLLAIDFAICEDEKGGFIPQLIELQGFASLYCYQEWLSLMYRKHFEIPDNFDNKFNGYTHQSYIDRLKQVVIGDQDPRETILLEIEPWKQKTQIDFHCTRQYLGIPVVCLTEVRREGRDLYFLRDGKRNPIRRIYNRVIFDELLQRTDLPLHFKMTEEVDVEWVAHPNWFFRISKHTMPSLRSKYVPETHFLSAFERWPDDPENWVLKPLFSFSGQGVVFDVTKADLDQVKDREQYILQRKVTYAGAVSAPNGPVKCEIRLLYLWDQHETRPTLAINLGRMSKGKMIGVRYNQDHDWVGGTTYFLEKDAP